MTTKWKKPGRVQSTQELEESMSQELADLGMLEQGMTFQDKRDLLNVVRLSQESAQAEEKERKTKVSSPLPQHTLVNSSENETDVLCKSDENREVIVGDEGDINQDILCNISMAVSDCDTHERSPVKHVPYTMPALEYLGDVNSSACRDGVHLKSKQSNSPNSPITLSSKDSEVGSVSGEPGVIVNGCENEESNILHSEQVEESDNDLDIFPSLRTKEEVNGLKRKKDDRERNIDVFSECNGIEHNFVRNINKCRDRIPFYFVPEGMGVRKYIAYFKCYVNQYYKNLAVIQRNNIEHLEWGAPITMDSSGFTSFRSNTDVQNDSSRRYNFRDRYPKPKLIDFTSENSEDAEEEESNDEDDFTPRFKKLPGIKLSAKRKNTSTNDSMSTKKEKKECLSIQRKMQEDGECFEDDAEATERLGGRGRGCAMSRKRSRKARSKHMQTQNEVPEEMSEMLPNVGIDSIIEPDIVIAEGPSAVAVPPLLDDMVNQASPLSVKQRRLQMQVENNTRQSRRKSEPRKNPDVVLIEEEIKQSAGEPVDIVPCPICWRNFPASDIEEHASECNQYSPDNSCSSTKT